MAQTRLRPKALTLVLGPAPGLEDGSGFEPPSCFGGNLLLFSVLMDEVRG